MSKLLTFFSAINSIIFAYHYVDCNESLTNDIVRFEQLGPEVDLINEMEVKRV